VRLIDLLIVGVVLVAAVILWRWYEAGGGFEVFYVVIGVALSALLLARRRLAQVPKTAEVELSVWGAPGDQDGGLAALRQQMEQAFSLDELRTLVFDLGLNYDNLAGETLARKVLSVVESCRRNGRLPDLVAQLKAVRPETAWALTEARTMPYPHAYRNRENLLNHVQTAWIEGYMKQSIHSEVLKLALNYRPEAVGRPPWQYLLQRPGQPAAGVPPERTMGEIFRESGRNLLILGAPGSGKTITMLQLADSLVQMARENTAEPIPIVLNLSSWARDKRPLAEWLVEEIFVQYGVARQLARIGIAQNQFLYLLDGLDEVAVGAREECLGAINAFKELYPAEMVVCSRIEEYEALKNRLHMGTAIQIQPLTDNQIDAYVGQEGLALQAVRVTLNQDTDFRELARTPVMLSLMTLAYRGLNRAELRPLADKEARRRHLFEHYVGQMFARRPLTAESPYSEAKARGWLANLARGMSRHDQSVFYIERLQPGWLPDGRGLRLFQLLSGLAVGLLVMLVIGLPIGLLTLIINGVIIGLVGGLIMGFIYGAPLTIELGDVLKWEWVGWPRFLAGFAEGVIQGILLVLSTGFAVEFQLGFFTILSIGFSLPVLGGLFSKYILRRKDAVSLGVLFGLIGGFGNSLLYQFGNVTIDGIKLALGVGIITGLIIGLAIGLFECIKPQVTETRLVPNQSIGRFARNALAFLLLGIVAGIGYGLVLWLLNGCLGEICFLPYFKMGSGFLGGMLVGVPAALMLFATFAISYGFNTIIRHYVLRFLLARAGILPYPFRDGRLIGFLDAMHDRILLRRVGGGWIFAHRFLHDYFMELSPNTPRD
jgi:hypothetical protein